MSDDWEDDEFVIAPLDKAPRDEGEEEIDLLTKEVENNAISSESIAANMKKKATESEIAFNAKLKSLKEVEETSDQRKLRERKQVEEADNELTEDLFDKSTAKPVTKPSTSSAPAPKQSASTTVLGIGSIPLSTNQDHFEFGNLVQVRLSDSTAFNVGAFYKGLTKVLKQPNITVEVLDDIMAEIKKVRDSKAKEVPGKKGERPKKNTKDVKKDAKRHNDIFGFADKVDKYSTYEDMEDDFL